MIDQVDQDGEFVRPDLQSRLATKKGAGNDRVVGGHCFFAPFAGERSLVGRLRLLAALKGNDFVGIFCHFGLLERLLMTDISGITF